MTSEDKSFDFDNSSHEDNTLIGPEPENISHNKPGATEQMASMYIAHYKLEADAKCRDLRPKTKARSRSSVATATQPKKLKPQAKPKEPKEPEEASEDDAHMEPEDHKFVVGRLNARI